MPELYLRVLDRVLTPVLRILALWLLLRGHNWPGGGFIAGLAAAASIQLQILSRGDDYVRRYIGPSLHPMTGNGLLMAYLAAIGGLFSGAFFEAIWWHIELGPLDIELGTPMIFDLGVFLVVVSVVTTYLLGLSRQEDEP
jgi:multicomponent Na+:H+ antiporter subunit B